jgi:3-isopropylmalate/(R)-2-methylmalate dehydratase small subunit
VDLRAGRLSAPDGTAHAFAVPPFARECLLRGLDEIGLTLTLLPEIEAYEAACARQGPACRA